MKQTAIEWLEEQIKDIFYVAEASEITKKFKSVYEQAKQMEKEDMESAYFCGSCDRMNDEGSFEQHYKETYGGAE
jgi:hypothetical protein